MSDFYEDGLWPSLKCNMCGARKSPFIIHVCASDIHAADAFAYGAGTTARTGHRVGGMDADEAMRFMKEMDEMLREAQGFVDLNTHQWYTPETPRPGRDQSHWNGSPEAARAHERAQRRAASDEFNRDELRKGDRTAAERADEEARLKNAERMQREREAAADAANRQARARAEGLRKAAEAFKNAGNQQSKDEWMRDRQKDFFRHFGNSEAFGRTEREQRQEPQPAQPSANGMDITMLRRLIQLCHPDKHNNSEGSQIATRFLLGIKSRLEGGH